MKTQNKIEKFLKEIRKKLIKKKKIIKEDNIR